MKKTDLFAAIEKVKTETRDALQIMYDELNHGQQQKVLNSEKVKSLFDRYGVNYTE